MEYDDCMIQAKAGFTFYFQPVGSQTGNKGAYSMRLRNITGSRELIAENKFVVHEPELCKGKWRQDIFHNNNYQTYQNGI